MNLAFMFLSKCFTNGLLTGTATPFLRSLDSTLRSVLNKFEAVVIVTEANIKHAVNNVLMFFMGVYYFEILLISVMISKDNIRAKSLIDFRKYKRVQDEFPSF